MFPIHERKVFIVDFAAVRQIALMFPGVEEGTSYGTPAFRVRGKLLARLWEDGATLVLGVDVAERDGLLALEPETFFLTDHYKGYPYVLVRLACITPAELQRLFEAAWKRAASQKMIVAYTEDES